MLGRGHVLGRCRATDVVFGGPLGGWVGVNPHSNYNEVLRVVFQVTDFILGPFQRLPLRLGMMDFSPLVAFIVLQFMHRITRLMLLQAGGFF